MIFVRVMILKYPIKDEVNTACGFGGLLLQSIPVAIVPCSSYLGLRNKTRTIKRWEGNEILTHGFVQLVPTDSSSNTAGSSCRTFNARDAPIISILAAKQNIGGRSNVVTRGKNA